MDGKFAIVYRPHGTHVERDQHTLYLTGDDVVVVEAALYEYVKNTKSQIRDLPTPQSANDEIVRSEQIREFLIRHKP